MKPLVIGRSAAAGRPADEPVAGGDSSRLAALAACAAAGLVVVGTLLQGFWTDRWGDKNVAVALKRDAEILERVFPERFGDWEFEKSLESDPKELERAGAVGHVSRLYRNVRTKGQVSAFVVCATPHDASGHTPDRCYPGAGFEVGESEHRQTVPLADGREAEAYTGTFRKQGQTLRVFWTYGVDGEWIAPQIARIELAGTEAVYKLYAIMDETRIKSQSIAECVDFIGTLLPALDRAVSEARAADGPATAPAAAQSAARPPDGRG